MILPLAYIIYVVVAFFIGLYVGKRTKPYPTLSRNFYRFSTVFIFTAGWYFILVLFYK